MQQVISTQATINLTLGESGDAITVETSDENREASIALIKQAKRSINILSYDLEPKIYNNRLLVSALRSFVALDRHNTVNILIHNSRNLVLYGHQLVELSRQFSSYITIKKLNAEDSRMTQGVLIADETGVILRHNAKRFDGFAHFNDRPTCRELMNQFDLAWHRALPTSELKRLFI